MRLNAVVTGLLALTLAGCAGTAPTAGPATGPASAPEGGGAPVPPGDRPTPGADGTRLPTATRPTAPPEDPTDQIKKTGWVVGTVVRGGAGPCYGLRADDGTEYALHATNGDRLTPGTRVRVRTQPTRLRIDCGTGRLVEMTAVQRLGA